MKLSRIICILFLLFCSTAVIHAETPDEAIIRLETEWSKGSGSFTKEFWKFSSVLGRKHGTAVIAPIMERSKKWKDEEGLIYVPVLALLPRDETVKILEGYKKGNEEKQKVWVKEFLTEFEMKDTKEAVKQFNAEPSNPANSESRSASE